MSSAAYWDQLQRAYQARQVVWLIGGFVLVAVIWAAFASIDEVVVGTGKLVPSASVQRVQSFDGGILRQLHVREGDDVVAGQLLVTLDETRAEASHAEADAEYRALVAKRVRLLHELDSIADNDIRLTPLPQSEIPGLEMEVASYEANLRELQGRVRQADESVLQQRRSLIETREKRHTLTSALVLLDKELDLTRSAVESGALSAAEVRKLERERVSLAGQLASTEIELQRLASVVSEAEQARQSLFDEFRARAQADLSDAGARIARLKEMLKGLSNQLEQTRLYAAMSGRVKSIMLNSIGGVVQPGETLLEIVPQGDQLLVEAQITPRDIARVRQGQEVIIKLSAYDFVIYGGIPGRVSVISPDAVTNEDGESFFVVQISGVTDGWKAGLWEDRPLISGMQAQVDILAGKKTILQYWMKPLLRARAESMREP